MRAGSMQFGYFAGSFTGGLALALGGYPALGSALGVLFLAAAAAATPSGRSRARRLGAAPELVRPRLVPYRARG